MKPYEDNLEMQNDELRAINTELLEACKKALTKELVTPRNWKSIDMIKTLKQAIAKAERGK